MRGREKDDKGGQYIQIKELGIGVATLLWDRQSTGYPPQLKTLFVSKWPPTPIMGGMPRMLTTFTGPCQRAQLSGLT